MIEGTQPLAHHVLDGAAAELGGRAFAIEHLRRLLIAAGALPDRDEHLHRAATHLNALITQAHPDDQRMLRAFATWHLLHRLRDRSHNDMPTMGSARWIRQTMTEATTLTASLRAAGRDLNHCTQTDIDLWLVERPNASRHLPPFLTWATRHHHAAPGLRITRPTQSSQSMAQPAHQRWRLAAQLLSEDTIADNDRVAGLLILLYGQTCARISRLQHHHITTDPAHPDTVQLRLGRDDTTLHDPLATLVQRLPSGGLTGTARALALHEGWLFPGRRPGRPIHPTSMANRLQALGLHPRPARNGALLELAQQVPPIVLADLLGLHITTAEKWAAAASGRWTNYAATRTAT